MPGLAYVGRIETLSPIPNADRIESADVVCGEGGRWTGVVKKGDFNLGDKATVYLQDAIVPPSDDMAFLKSTNWRVKMARFRGAPSECVIMPFTSPDAIGTDLTEALGIKKYEKALTGSMGGNPLGNFPTFIPKTDEPNFQTAYRIVEALRGQPWYATMKYDGSSTTAYRWKDHFGVCSRNLELVESGCVFWNVAKKFDLPNRLPSGIALQWETVGPGVQKNPLGLSEVTGYAFNGFDIENHRYFNRDELRLLCCQLGFPIVETVEAGVDFQPDAETLRKAAEGLYPNGKQREGIVIRPEKEQWVGHSRLSFKSINLLYKE